MIWFGNLERFFVGKVPAGLPQTAEFTRMQLALERVAELAPGLSGRTLVEAVTSTGWVDRETAERLLPHFRHFDSDAHFAAYLRRLSFRGRSAEEEFRSGVRCVIEDLLGNARIDQIGPEKCVRFVQGDREGIVLAQPEVSFTIAGRTRDSIIAAIEEMPDAVVVVARNFEKGAAQQLGSILSRTGVPGTLVSLNLLLGLRATALRYQPRVDRVIDLLSAGGSLRSFQIARLGDREAA
jgi:hypothetical protein